jgi:predicted sulfurtransferase
MIYATTAYLARNHILRSSKGIFFLSSSSKTETLALNVEIDSDIRHYLNLKKHERKVKILLPADMINPQRQSIQFIRSRIENKVIALRDEPYALKYGFMLGLTNQKLNKDIDVSHLLSLALSTNVMNMKILVSKVCGIYPPPKHEYLVGMSDPLDSESYTVISFYRFQTIEAVDNIRLQLLELWKPFEVTGRVYLASEGINAQMVVPSNVLEIFKEACDSCNLLKDIYVNVDHVMTKNDYETTKPFKALHIRVKDQIVADGFNEPFDWNKAGREIDPLDWHNELENENAFILDCRNSYESDVGKFKNAIPLNTTFFRESWDSLEAVLKDVPKDAPIMTYCTGGIRCVKVNAYLEQKMGYTNVGRLKGIICLLT